MKQLPWMLLLFSTAIQQNVFSQTAKKTSTLPAIDSKSFFTTEEPLEMVMVSDFKMKFSVTDSLADSIRISPRGEFRRELCQMPSLMINFKGRKSSPLNQLKKMKMVCGCSSSEYNESLVLTEYLVYKIYNLLTDMSFRVRLVKTLYKDVSNKVKPVSQYAFLIEDVDEMALRNQCKEYEKQANSFFSNRSQMTLMTIFQYMIGNTDWSIPNYHNIKLIQPLKDSMAMPFIVPYDFDFSGLVNATYAFPNHELFTIDKVTDRFYRGMPRAPEEIEPVLNIFKNNKEKILQLVQQFNLLKESDRRTMISYLEEFYKTINNKKKVDYFFVNGARQ
jgi:hypothetical protein